MIQRTPPHVMIPVVLIAFAGAVSALAGAWWDDAWHTERGRDDFFIAPHIAIYAGITAAGGALSVWALLTARAHGTVAVLRHRPLRLALLSVAVTLASGPIDNAWHVAFGRDSVIWSAPHMLGLVGTLALGASILAELAGRPESWARSLAVGAGALVLASASFATAEYETDVPQFDETFYLPVLGFASAFALMLVRTAADARWAATTAAMTYTGFIALVSVFLTLEGFSAPALPLILAPALVIDMAHRGHWRPLQAAAAFTAALHLVYVPVRNLLGDGVRFDAIDVVTGAVLTLVAVYAIFRVSSAEAGSSPPSSLAVTGAAATMLVVVLATPAWAHDPGQGQDAGTVALRVSVDVDRVTLDARLPAAMCRSTVPRAVVARRAGETLRAPLTKRGCDLQGTLELATPGRWFVYAEMSRDGEAVETWLPIDAGDGRQSATDPARYAYVPAERSGGAIQILSSVVLYGGILALLHATLRLVRASRRATRPADGHAGAPAP